MGTQTRPGIAQTLGWAVGGLAAAWYFGGPTTEAEVRAARASSQSSTGTYSRSTGAPVAGIPAGYSPDWSKLDPSIPTVYARQPDYWWDNMHVGDLLSAGSPGLGHRSFSAITGYGAGLDSAFVFPGGAVVSGSISSLKPHPIFRQLKAQTRAWNAYARGADALRRGINPLGPLVGAVVVAWALHDLLAEDFFRLPIIVQDLALETLHMRREMQSLFYRADEGGAALRSADAIRADFSKVAIDPNLLEWDPQPLPVPTYPEPGVRVQALKIEPLPSVEVYTPSLEFQFTTVPLPDPVPLPQPQPLIVPDIYAPFVPLPFTQPGSRPVPSRPVELPEIELAFHLIPGRGLTLKMRNRTRPLPRSQVRPQLRSGVRQRTRSVPLRNRGLHRDRKRSGTWYVAALQMLNRTWGKVTELDDAWQVVSRNIYVTAPVRLTLASGRTLVWHPGTPLALLPLAFKLHVLKNADSLWDDLYFDFDQIVLGLLVEQVQDWMIGRLMKAERSWIRAKGHRGLADYGNWSTWFRRLHRAFQQSQSQMPPDFFLWRM